ncbi:transposase [Novosphingobium flavum]|uniref:Transposase n=1 Tax=Novosphingobium flavum TaxID=1778672 RepID=A0A7X1FRT9_9SPHN|nr:transposase [Novosphingobium flavum]MBC2665785.1 transposase [Novosphingobium flavum]
MPRLIDCPDTALVTLGECADAIHAAGFAPSCEESLAETALWLRRLGNNPDFLGDILVESLKHRHRDEPAQGYGPQAIQLTRPKNGVFLRAAVWPAMADAMVAASGSASFVYGLPHDHNFSFLTHGYFGPGYWSDYYEYDYEAVSGWTGELAHLTHTGRRRLEPGKVMLYRAHRDVHRQLPADSLSVSLNVMHAEPAMHWLDQYSFDVEKGTITGRVDSGPSEAFLKIAVALGTCEALDLAEHVAASHPSERMRLTALDALAGQAPDHAARDALWARAERSGLRMVAMEARARRAELA